MTSDLLLQLEQKVAYAVEVIELLRMQVEELEEENIFLKAEQEKWRNDLANLIKRFDKVDTPSASASAPAPVMRTRSAIRVHAEDEEFMTV